MLKLSFILPCYNVAPYIGRCIESIEAQDIPQMEYEVICVDDCSKDNTVEVIKEYQKRYPNIRLICHTENKTAGGARNTGIDAAQGEYIWCVDPDDSIRSKVIGVLISKAEMMNLDILLFNLSMKKENGQQTKESIIHKSHNRTFTGKEYIEQQCAPRYIYNVAFHTCCLYKREFLNSKSIRYPEIRAAQDVVFVWSSMFNAQRVSAKDTVCYNVIRRPNSTTGSKGCMAARAILSQSLLFAYEIHALRDKNKDLGTIVTNSINQAIGYALNTDSRNILYTTKQNQKEFYKSLQQNKEKINVLHSYMNRKTKRIFAYNIPYILWQCKVWAYRIINNVKQRESISYEK